MLSDSKLNVLADVIYFFFLSVSTEGKEMHKADIHGGKKNHGSSCLSSYK